MKKIITLFAFIFCAVFSARAIDCSSLWLDFSSDTVGLTAFFTDTSAHAGVETYSWDFGDGASSDAHDPHHTYAAAGTYTVTLVITWIDGGDTCTHDVAHTITIGSSATLICDSLVAAFGYDTADGTVHFVDSSTSTTFGTHYLWHFGDGLSSDAHDPSHIYSSSGIYTVSLTVTWTDGSDTCTHTVSHVVTFGDTTGLDCALLVPGFTTDTSGLTVHVTDSSSPGYMVRYLWDFGDGSALDTTYDPHHTYLSAGVYDITHYVTWISGSDTCVHFVTEVVTIGDTSVSTMDCSLLSLLFTADTVGLTAYFTDTSTALYTEHYYWSFGDSTYSDAHDPHHTYSSAGIYLVKLTITWTDGTDTCVHDVTHLVTIGSFDTTSIDCSSLSLDFTYDTTGMTAFFTDSSSAVYTEHYYWAFGDGTYSDSHDPHHTYSATGTYLVTETITWVHGTDSCTHSVIHLVTIGGSSDTTTGLICDSLMAGFGYDTTGMTVYFSDSTTSGYTEHYLWTFGDGATSDAHDPHHTYSTSGTYTVKLLVTWISGGDTCTHLVTHDVIVGGASDTGLDCGALSLSFDYTASGLTASFYDSSTSGYTEHYVWHFGDGTTSYIHNPHHTYSSSGTYTVNLTIIWIHGSDTCTHDVSHVVTVGLLCDSLMLDFYADTAGMTAYFYDTSTSGYTEHYTWHFGDGTTGDGHDPHHTYSTPGVYTVGLTITWYLGSDSCSHDVVHTITVGGGGSDSCNTLSGTITFDGPAVTDSTYFKVWLITFDSSTGLLKAIDSTYSFVVSGHYRYEFHNVPTGLYRTKAQMMIGDTVGSSGYVPTYDSASLYWGDAWVVDHLCATADGHVDIHMQYGTVTSGPGFISGDVTTGAGKGTSGTVPVVGMTIYLRDVSTGEVVTFVVTDGSGNYSFSNVAAGTYNVYPEALNYATTPSANYTISTSTTTITNVNFTQDAAALTIVPSTESVANATANSRIDIYPNPSQGMLHIDWNGLSNASVHIAITDAVGHEVWMQDKVITGQKATSHFNVSQLADGFYLVTVKSDKINFTKQLVIKH